MAHQCTRDIAAVIVLLFLHQQRGGLAQTTIIKAPTTAVVPLGGSHTFPCVVIGSDVLLIINNARVDHTPTLQEEFKAKGFLFADSTDPLSLNVTIPATLETNNTEIRCEAHDPPNTQISDPASLIVIGSPSMPDPELQVVTPTTLLLSWNVPFTWDDYDILNYTITIQDTTGAHVMQQCVIDAPCIEMQSTGSCNGIVLPLEGDNATAHVSCSETNIAVILDTNGEVSESCEELKFCVAAANSLGISNTAAITGGFPIAPPPFSSPVNTSVLFKSDGSPIVQIHFMCPPVCTFQDPIEYTITVENLNLTTNNTFMLGPMSVSGEDCEKLIEEDIEGLMIDMMYLVTVTVYTVAGSSNTTTHYSTHFDPTMATTDIKPTEEGSGTVLTEANSTKDDDDILLIAVPAAAGAVVLVTLCICIIIACVYCRNRRARRKNIVQTEMVNNPIYEGPVYESITDLNTLKNSDESRYLDNPVNAMATRGEAYGTSAYCQNYGDAYTVMRPVHVHGKTEENGTVV